MKGKQRCQGAQGKLKEKTKWEERVQSNATTIYLNNQASGVEVVTHISDIIYYYCCRGTNWWQEIKHFESLATKKSKPMSYEDYLSDGEVCDLVHVKTN